MNEQELKEYYNKFNENKRLTRRHGIVEFKTSTKYINKYLKEFTNPKILDIGAGTGIYSGYFSNLGYDVTAVELVKHNFKQIKKNYPKVKSYLGNALNLSKFKDNSFDIILLFGPLYHLISFEEKVKCINEAKRVLKQNGYIFISYYMNNYAIIKHGFLDKNILQSIKDNKVDKDFHIISNPTDLYSYSTLEDINTLNKTCNLKRINIISEDSLTDYFRKEINSLTEEEFNLYLQYHFSICEKPEFLGFSSHIIDILKKTE